MIGKLDKCEHGFYGYEACEMCNRREAEFEMRETESVTQFNMRRVRAEIIDACAEELERAHSECSTLNLLHGAARIRALKAL